MSSKAGVILLVAIVLLLPGCGRRAPAPTINDSMTEVMEPHAQTIWDITSRAYNEIGDGLDGTKLSPADWAALGKAGQQIKDRALVLADAKHVTVAGPGETIMGEQAAGIKGKIGPAWDAASARQVQARIDADPSLFAQRARALADAGDAIVRASISKDTQLLYTVSSGLDEACDACHLPFWGTDEPPPVPH
ncbi:MAG: hypothetical protein ACM3YM_09125 [Sphingomonadales bacterium]